MVRLRISYGYDIHSIEMDEKSYSAIQNGQRVDLDGQGFHHEAEGFVADHWVFNGERGELYFWLDSGAEFFAQAGPWIEHETGAPARPYRSRKRCAAPKPAKPRPRPKRARGR